MKFKPTEKAGGLVVEFRPQETQFPPLAAEETRGALPVFKLKKILVPVDFSECSRKALGYAVPLAEQFGAELTLLHVAASNPPVAQLGPADEVALEEARKQLESLQARIGAAVPSHSVLRVLRTGRLHLEIIRAAEEMGIDLIVLSTHGHRGVARVLMGSTTEKVVRYAGCPVLVVREHQHEFVADAAGRLEEQ